MSRRRFLGATAGLGTAVLLGVHEPRAASAQNFIVDLTPGLKHTSGKKFPNQKVVVVSVSGIQGEFIGKVAKPWEDATGATVELNLIAFGDLQDKVLAALTTGIFIGDILDVPAYMGGDLMGGGYIEPIPPEIRKRLDMNDVLPVYRTQDGWGGVMYGYPWDGDVHTMYYRKDLIADPANRAKYKARFGTELAAPRDWTEYRQVAEFFTGKWANGKQHYGSVELVAPRNQGFHGFISHVAAFAKMPGNPAFFFNPDTMDAEVNNPGFVAGLEHLKSMLAFSPPEMINWGFTENAQAFVGGLCVLDIQWADIGPMSVDPKISVTKGKVGFAPTPGSKQTWDSKNKKWVDFPNINFAPYEAFAGWENFVAKNARSKEAAMDLSAFLASPEVMLLACVTGGSGVTPARYSTIHAIGTWVKSGLTAAEARAYLGAQQKSAEDPNVILQLRLPGYIRYQNAVELAVSKALTNQASSQQALDEAAKAWNAITDELGRDNQKKLYRQSIGLPA